MGTVKRSAAIIILICLSALISACGTAAANRAGGAERVRARVDAGADVNGKDPDSGRTLLHDAVSAQAPDLVEALAAKGADVNAADGAGFTPLILAVRANNIQIVNLLLEKGAGIDIADGNGKTALMYSCESGGIEISRVLIGKGADVCPFDSSGFRAADYARSALKSIDRDSSPALYEQKKALLTELRDREIRRFAVTNPPYARLLGVVRKVGRCLAPDTDYAVYISSKDQINAWVSISGSITFTRKALDAWDEDTLTLVAAHEIAHDRLGHVAKKMGVSYTTSTIMAIAGYIVPGLGYLNLLINPAITNNFSKLQEYDADKLAAESCSRCFGMSNERQLEVMRSMRDQSKGDGGGFFSTHPAWNSRIENIRK